MKKCTACKREKSIDEFRKAKGYKDGIFSTCKTCEKERLKEWRKANPDKVKAQNTRSNTKRRINETGYFDPNRKEEWSRAKRSAHLKRKYGITIEEFERISKDQGDRCKTCLRGTDEIWLCVDHCHTSGKIRGLLCNTCNSALGGVNDNVETLENMIEYLNSA
jgi:hypothetical protein